MSTHIGRQVNVGYAREATRGTAVAAEYWDKQADLSIDEKFELGVHDTAFGQVEDADGGTVLTKMMEGSIRAHAKSESLGLLLFSVFGGLATTGPTDTSVYTHTYTVAQTNVHQSLTISTNDAVQDYRFTNAVISDFELILEAGKFVDYSISFMGRNGATATNSVSFNASEQLFIAKHVTVKQATSSAGLGAASAMPIHRMSLKVAHNIETEYILGSITPNDFLNKQFTITGEMELYFQNETEFKTKALAGTAIALEIKLTNTDVTIGASTNPTLTITLYQTKVTELSRDLGKDGVVKQKVAFKAFYDTTATKMVDVVLLNLVADYTP